MNCSGETLGGRVYTEKGWIGFGHNLVRTKSTTAHRPEEERVHWKTETKTWLRRGALGLRGRVAEHSCLGTGAGC